MKLLANKNTQIPISATEHFVLIIAVIISTPKALLLKLFHSNRL